MTMLNLVKQSLRVSVDDYNDELNMLIAAAVDDLGIAGVINIDTETDPLIKAAICTFCKIRFGGQVEDGARLQASYDEQKAQLSTASGHTDWLDGEE